MVTSKATEVQSVTGYPIAAVILWDRAGTNCRHSNLPLSVTLAAERQRVGCQQSRVPRRQKRPGGDLGGRRPARFGGVVRVSASERPYSAMIQFVACGFAG